MVIENDELEYKYEELHNKLTEYLKETMSPNKEKELLSLIFK